MSIRELITYANFSRGDNVLYLSNKSIVLNLVVKVIADLRCIDEYSLSLVSSSSSDLPMGFIGMLKYYLIIQVSIWKENLFLENVCFGMAVVLFTYANTTMLLASFHELMYFQYIVWC